MPSRPPSITKPSSSTVRGCQLVCIGNVVTEEKHNRAQSAALCLSFIHHIKDFLNAGLQPAINATELQRWVLLSVKAALRRRA
ncbi:hypothetical protein D9C73_019791 [Collichthys lucidus]|uniref:Uncharacterized protein n=1 Tax=Collichthys lucidus TaxID=240159 RepID=A0A4U5VD60_COLLU|nr:hypothetical protein D9C73_019791 [Collichthys lucidus]